MHEDGAKEGNDVADRDLTSITDSLPPRPRVIIKVHKALEQRRKTALNHQEDVRRESETNDDGAKRRGSKKTTVTAPRRNKNPILRNSELSIIRPIRPHVKHNSSKVGYPVRHHGGHNGDAHREKDTGKGHQSQGNEYQQGKPYDHYDDGSSEMKFTGKPYDHYDDDSSEMKFTDHHDSKGHSGKRPMTGPGLHQAHDDGFTCEGKPPGFYANVARNCEVYHICVPGHRMYTHRCGRGTIFNQRFLVCDHQGNYDCQRAARDYESNARFGAFGK